ncbi:MAG: hypothetical protein ABSD89_05825 [Halobacteriota archaeon]
MKALNSCVSDTNGDHDRTPDSLDDAGDYTDRSQTDIRIDATVGGAVLASLIVTELLSLLED